MSEHAPRRAPRTGSRLTPTSIGTVLILDDSLTVRMDLVAAFGAAGWATLPAATAAQARQILAGTTVDALVLDVILPDADGVDVLRELRDDPATQNLPVLMLSSEGQIKDRIRGLRTGADEYIGKPYDAAYLISRAQELIESRAERASDTSRVLVIAETSTIRQSIREDLEDAGYDVMVAGTGGEGLRLAATGRVQAVLVDGTLPDLEGATVIRRIRLDSMLRGIPCLLLTDADDLTAELRALDAGADAFVRKQADPGLLLAKLSAALRIASSGSPVVDTASLQSPKKILAIGGDAATLAALADRVHGEGYDVVPARSDADAMELLAFQAMDCILLQVSGRDPADVVAICRRVKSAPGLADVPMILLGETGQSRNMVEALAAGADDYVLVGDLHVLAARIRAQLRRKQIQDEHRRIRETLLRREIEATEARAEAEIAQTKAAMVEELERKNRELEAFAYSVSHDLRAPLRSIDGFTRALGDAVADHLDDDGDRHLQRIRAGVTRMTEMIDDMLELSRISRLDLRRTEVNLGALGAAILSDLAAGDPHRQVTVVVQDPITASADPRLIRNVLENLLGNAWKFTTKCEAPRVELGSTEKDGEQVYFVRDNGAGFNLSRADRLFSPFQRYHGQSDFPGTGIGLATVHRIIDRHGGQIWADAEVGHGATFWFTLPI